MNLLIVNKSGIGAKNIHIPSFVIALSIVLFLVLISSLAYTIHHLNQPNGIQQLSQHLAPQLEGDDQLYALVQLQKQELEQTQLEAQSQVEALSLRLAKMQAQVMRLEQLGQKLVKVAKLNKKEFDFNDNPAIGGPNMIQLPELEKRIASVLAELDSKESQLTVIETLIEQRIMSNLQKPKGKPTQKGWISSYFGQRKDPFTGRQSMHRGIDVAGKEGEKIVATANGVVTWAEERSGYGKLIEVDHGNGLLTRYGHCESIDVEVGQQVMQGESLGTIGSTGRSTGPHIHYEVIKNGVKVNPLKYVRQSRVALNLH